MKPQSWKGVVALGAFLGLVIEPSFGAAKLALVELGIPHAFTSSRATGINNRGQVVGWAVSKDDVTHAILWDNGATVDLGTMGGSDSLASGISTSGDIVGVTLHEGIRHVFLWRKGQVLDFGPVEKIGGRYVPGTFNTGIRINSIGQVMGPPLAKDAWTTDFLYDRDHIVYIGKPGWGIGGYLNGVNDRGQIVGTTCRTNGCSHAFVWQEGQLIDIGGLGGTMAGATVINESGMVIGWAFVGSTPETAHAFVWEHGQMQDIGTLGGETSRAYGLNNLGQVVGYSNTATNTVSAFIWENGVMRDLNDFVSANSGWRATCGDAINDRGQIAVYATKNGQKAG
jgi:probable HAF family extracellular repeat protein